MGYGFRHVLIVQKAQASELKPHIWNNIDLQKKIKHFKYCKPPCSYHIVPILDKVSSETSSPSELLFLGGLLPKKPKYIMDLRFLV